MYDESKIKLSRFGCIRREQVRGNSGDGLWDEVAGTSPIADTVAVSYVTCAGLLNGRYVNGVGKLLKYFVVRGM